MVQLLRQISSEKLFYYYQIREIITLLGPGWGALWARIVFILRFPKIFNSNYVLKFFDFSYNYITFMITTKKGVWEVSGGCLDGVWGLSGGISGSG